MKQEEGTVGAENDERALRKVQVSHHAENQRYPYSNDTIESAVQNAIDNGLTQSLIPP
jgi:hypothetical protein